jgi:aryl sulfotransferase
MTTDASILAPASRTYRGDTTDPDRWTTWGPRKGDILVCTPPKCGTTWTQTILAMLVHGGPDLPEKVPVLSPWVDGDLGVPAKDVATALSTQKGRRVVKTHTPADGFPVWQDVIVIAVYRHPLDVFFSLRKHAENTKNRRNDHPMRWPIPRSIHAFLEGPSDINDFDRDTLATFTEHYEKTALSGRLPDSRLFHYSDMIRDGRAAVDRLAKAAEIDADAALLDAVTEATAFSAMRAKATDYAPVSGTGYWKSDAGFFDSASSNKWEGKLTEEEIAQYRARLANLVPETQARTWLENGNG